MEYKLDIKDKKLLYLLLQNSNTPLKRIASLVGLSKNAVSYRINKLKKDGIIERFHPVIDHHSLGYYTSDIFLKYRAKEIEEKKIRDYIIKNPNIVWATYLFGKWDLFIQIITSEDFTEMLKEILSHFSNNLEQYEAKTHVRRLKISHQIFEFSEKNLYIPIIEKKIQKIVEIDNIDRKILSHLSNVDALSNYREIAKAVNASPETVRNRVRRLYKEGVILYSMPFINHRKIGLRSYIVNLIFRNMTSEKEKELEQYVNSNKLIKIAFRSQEKLEIYFWVVIKDIEELEKLLREMKNRFFDEILDTSYNFVTEEIKLNYFPEALVKAKE